MNNIRLLPVVVLAIAALLVLKTLGLVTNGSYVLTGTSLAQASGAPASGGESGGGAGDTPTMSEEPTMQDSSPTLTDPAPTMSPQTEASSHAAPAEAAAGHGATDAAPATEAGAVPAEGEAAHADAAATDAAPGASSGTYCLESDAAIDAEGNVIINPASANAAGGEGAEPAPVPPSGDGMPAFAESMTDCLPTGDAVPLLIDGKGGVVPLLTPDATNGTDQVLLERLAARRDELKKYEDDLTLRSSIVDAAEKRIAERASTLSALEAQISSLVDQRQQMETGQFAGIVAMYETMKPKDAASIFNSLDMDVLLRVAKAMSPRKMAPILAAMDTARAQELTVQMASVADNPTAAVPPVDLATLPQIVGQ